MRILMMGTGPFAVPTFEGLLASRHEVLALMTRPVPAASRRRQPAADANPMREVAEQKGLKIHWPESVNSPDSIAILREYSADLHVVCDYGQILSAEALSTSRLGGINLHASLLPRYRGAAPINWALYNGVSETGVTVIHMTPRLDAGPCLVQESTGIGPTEDAVELETRLAQLGWQSVQRAIDQLDGWDGKTVLGVVQDNAAATRAPRLKKSDGLVDWTRSAQQVYDQVRAFKPWPGTFSHWSRPKGALRLLLTEVEVDDATGQKGPPGSVLLAEEDQLIVACGQGSLRLVEVQPAGKNRLEVRDFLRGYPIQVGAHFQCVVD